MTSDPKAYWRDNLRLLAILLSIWFLSGFCASILFVDALNKIDILGVPGGFWFAQQGSIYVFVVLIFVYALRMRQLEAKHGVGEGE